MKRVFVKLFLSTKLIISYFLNNEKHFTRDQFSIGIMPTFYLFVLWF